MKTLNLYPVSTIDTITQPETSVALNLHTRATKFFTDFSCVTPLAIESTLSALDIQKIMQKEHVRLKFVIDKAGHFLGVVRSEDVTDRKIMQKTNNGDKREDITLADVMIPKHRLNALDYHEVAGSSIGQVVRVLKDTGDQHALVIDRDRNEIRGIFSASDISRKLHLAIDIQNKPSFSKVFEMTD